ncbi:hypothetical protein HPB52_023384 [Rhipicephalus sanguineus]|uniref:Uncharacterized protein n=1 Tax=Rhipicephalus sanguineus TaxID=34632 RepID=A0A9D4YQV2_RHISA|nr:hypothetical protein HPB52_023384 [Rhipicephalus sanguineus]
MAQVLNLLFSKALSSEELLEWLTDPKYKATVVELQSLESERKNFIQVFIDFIRDQCPFIQQTPSPTKVRRPISPSARVSSCDSVLALKHDSAVCVRSRPPAVGRRQTTVRVAGECNKPLTLPTTAAQPDSSSVSRAEISSSELSTPCIIDRRPVSKGEQTQPAVSVFHNAPDIGDRTIFPAVNAVVENQRPIRRITPTPVKSHWRKLTLSDFLPPEVSHECQRKDSHRSPRQPHKDVVVESFGPNRNVAIPALPCRL